MSSTALAVQQRARGRHPIKCAGLLESRLCTYLATAGGHRRCAWWDRRCCWVRLHRRWLAGRSSGCAARGQQGLTLTLIYRKVTNIWVILSFWWAHHTLPSTWLRLNEGNVVHTCAIPSFYYAKSVQTLMYYCLMLRWTRKLRRCTCTDKANANKPC